MPGPLFDYTIHFGDVITGALLTAIGYGLRQFYKMVRKFVLSVNTFDERLERSNQVIDDHSELLEAHGLAQARELIRVSKKRRVDDWAETE